MTAHYETRLMAPGRFTIDLDRPPENITQLTARFRAAVIILPGRITNPKKVPIAQLLADACYVGIHTARPDKRMGFAGYGPAWLLKRAPFPADLNISKRPLYDGANNSWLRRILGVAEGETNGLEVGALTVAAGAASPTKGGKIPAGQERLEALGDIARRFGKEWDIRDGNQVEVVARSALFAVTPTCYATPKGQGGNLNLDGLDAVAFDERDDTDDFATTVAVPFTPEDWEFNTAYAVGDTVKDDDGDYYECTSAHTSTGQTLPGGTGTWATKWDVIDTYGEATTGSVPYVNPFDGDDMVERKVEQARNADTLTDANTIATARLGRWDQPQRAITLDTETFDLSGKVIAGDNIYAFSREHDLYDTTAQVPFNGRPTPMATVRVQAARVNVDPAMTVLVRSWDGAEFDLDDITPWVAFEKRGQTLELGEPKRRRATTAVTV